jgi:hypothetical protein
MTDNPSSFRPQEAGSTPVPASQGGGGSNGWQRHDGGPNPAPGELVDLTWGFGVILRQPSAKVNWSIKWEWRLSRAPAPPATPTEALVTTGAEPEDQGSLPPIDVHEAGER